MKGQTAVFEEVMLFGIGVGIFITSFMIFTNYQTTSLEITTQDHMTEILNYLSSTVLEISRTQGNVSRIVSIPDKIDNNYYMISFNNDGIGIEIIPDGRNVSSNLYGIQNSPNIIIKENTIASISGKIIIYKKGMEMGINTINI